MKSRYIAKSEKLIIDSGSTINFIDSAKIILCQQKKETVIFQMTDQAAFEIPFKISELAKLLEESTFIKTNDEFLINLKYLEQIPEPEAEYIKMANNLQVPVDKACKQAIIEALEDTVNF